MFLLCLSVKKKWQSSCDHPFGKISTITLPEMLMALSVNPGISPWLLYPQDKFLGMDPVISIREGRFS